MNCSGKIKIDKAKIAEIKDVLGIKDDRTLQKYLLQLKQLNWIGFSNKSGFYFIRSFGFIRKSCGFTKRTIARYYPKDHENKFDEFLFASFVGESVRRQKFYVKINNIKESNNALYKTGSAKHKKRFLEKDVKNDYFGLSNKTIGEKLGLSKTRASELKNKTRKSKLIISEHKFRAIRKFKGFQKGLLNVLSYATKSERFRLCSEINDNKQKIIVLLEQLHDEIISSIEFRQTSKFSTLF
jgi:hypothetical protein